MKSENATAELKCLQYYQMHRRIGMITFEGIREIE